MGGGAGGRGLDLTERVRIKGENLWAEDGMRAKISLVEHILDEGKPGLL